jgi:glycosyltransferase involved in cell wall biosynthesis
MSLDRADPAIIPLFGWRGRLLLVSGFVYMNSPNADSEEAHSDETLVVVVPCYNEEANIEQTVQSIRAVASELPLRVDVLLIDDGSSDGTKGKISELCQRYGYSAMYNEHNRGVGWSLLEAYSRIDPGYWVTIMPGDNEIDFASIKGFVRMRDDFDLILGYLQNPVIRPLGRRLFSVAYMRTVRIIYGFPFRYLNGMKLFRANVFQGIDVEALGHAFNSELLAKAILRDPSIRIGEASFIARGRATGNSNAIRPSAVAQSVLEVGRGWRSVAQFRNKVTRGD